MKVYPQLFQMHCTVSATLYWICPVGQLCGVGGNDTYLVQIRIGHLFYDATLKLVLDDAVASVEETWILLQVV